MHERDYRVSLLGRVATTLQESSIAHALIGASALAFYGVSRSTHDVDLLAVDASCLDPRSWSGLEREGVAVDLRRGDAADPLRGVVRFTAKDERPVDLVVGRASWQGSALARAEPRQLGDSFVPVLRAPDLILLKLFAGGPQDAWDVAQLLAAGDRAELIEEVERLLPELPAECSALWRAIKG